MHPALQGFNIITWYLILATEETAIKFMQEVGLIPTYLSPCPACPLCGSETKSQKMPSRKLGFRYVCSERSKKKNVTERESVGDYYSYFREIAEVFASHHSKQLGGPGKTILLDETFLTKRKYNRGRITASMTQTVFGIFCK
ncbi:hypothetical protein CEXT_21851 [Caerostris extrusa]|uniref:Transposase n=1 Tax=Caerostris extrusa TaxID=172846 RepID=A0AAV4TM81_CAEEX|nr:hypothetical protein CEXT_21851 [Caerostris extrusa]